MNLLSPLDSQLAPLSKCSLYEPQMLDLFFENKAKLLLVLNS